MLWSHPAMESISSLLTPPVTATQTPLAKNPMLTAWSEVSVQEGLVLQVICWKSSSLGEKIMSALQPGKSLGRNCLLVSVFTVSDETLSQAWLR